MKKYILSLMAALVVFSVLAGCTGKPEPTPTPDNKPGSVEFDDSDLSGLIDDDNQPDGNLENIDVTFKDPDNSDGIVVTPKETKSPESPTPGTTPESSPTSTQKQTSAPVQTPAPTIFPATVPTPGPATEPDIDIDTDTKGGSDIDIDIASAGEDQTPDEADSSMRFGDIVVTPKDPDMNVIITPKEPQ